MISTNKFQGLVAGFITVLITLLLFSCNNPFKTRKPKEPDQQGGKALKPATSPENVLYNLRVSFENMSIQDYLDVYSEDFVFNPDPDDSIKYEEDFRDGWGFEKENIFAENFLQRIVTSEIQVYPNYVYKPGQDMYEYNYSIFVFPADSVKTETIKVKGYAWIYFKENEEKKWKVYKWVEMENMIEGSYITWGVLRVLNI